MSDNIKGMLNQQQKAEKADIIYVQERTELDRKLPDSVEKHLIFAVQQYTPVRTLFFFTVGQLITSMCIVHLG